MDVFLFFGLQVIPDDVYITARSTVFLETAVRCTYPFVLVYLQREAFSLFL